MTDPPAQPVSLSRLAIHSLTNKPWPLRECIDAYGRAGIGGISVWREAIELVGLEEAARILRGSGLHVPALVRGGFFVHPEKRSRSEAINEARRCIDEAATIGADMLVIVPGSHPQIDLIDGRRFVSDALAALVEHATSRSVRLALEPLHPMYAADRSCVNTLAQARVICDAINHPSLGVAVDVYHVWWYEALEQEIKLLGRAGRLFAFHVNDWLPNPSDLLFDRGLMGEGCIPLRRIREWMESSGFGGSIEVEILSKRWWKSDQHDYLQRIVRAFTEHV